MRYLINDKYYEKGSEAPIFFYAGNEGEITNFYDNTGFFTKTLAQEKKGLLVYAEHRFYGKSMPFGDKSFDKENLRYLTVEGAMMDYVKLIEYIKSDESGYDA